MQPAHASHVTFEPPDVAHWYLIGRVEASDIVRIYKAQLEFAKDKRYILVIIDVSHVESITPAARRAAATGPTQEPGQKIMPVRGSAVIGASFHIQVLGLLVAKAAKLIHRQEEIEPYFCNTEAQARSWVEKRRREIEMGR